MRLPPSPSPSSSTASSSSMLPPPPTKAMPTVQRSPRAMTTPTPRPRLRRAPGGRECRQNADGPAVHQEELRRLGCPCRGWLAVAPRPLQPVRRQSAGAGGRRSQLNSSSYAVCPPGQWWGRIPQDYAGHRVAGWCGHRCTAPPHSQRCGGMITFATPCARARASAAILGHPRRRWQLLGQHPGCRRLRRDSLRIFRRIGGAP